ncbi:MAG: C1 family peptidase [Ferruginibacter sp.]
MTGAAATRSEPAPGFCNGANLQVPIIDTSYYTDISKEQLPSKFILDMPTPGDQGNQGSCAAWATVYGVGSFYVHFTTGKPYSDTGNLSPRFIYNQISKGDCSCTSVLDNLYLLKTQGACTVNAMPYDANDCSTQPDSMQRSLAENYKIKGWQKIELHNLSLLKRAITESKPIIFSISTDQGFRKISKPFMWDTREGAIEPAHSMILAGYDDEKKAFRVMNSWGTAWGDKGFAWIGYDFFLTNVLRGGHIVL